MAHKGHRREEKRPKIPFGQMGTVGNGVKELDKSALEKEFALHEKAGFKDYRKKVGITSTFTDVDFGER